MRSGFTLVELLVTIAIIGILAAVALPNFMKSRDLAQERAAQAYARNVFTIGYSYTAEDSSRAIATADCTNGYSIGGKAIKDPGNAVATCSIADADADGEPEVVVTAITSQVFNYP